MEISEVRRRVGEAIERARRTAAERRARADEAAREYSTFLDHIAVPLFRQVANVLKAQGYPFSVFTPSGSVRLMSEKSSEDYIELTLDTTGDEPQVIGHSSRARGRRVVETERPVGDGPVRNLTEEQALGFLLKELEPFVEK
jgi:hypothetical protein